MTVRPSESPLAMPAQSFAAPPKTARAGTTSRLWRKAFVGAAATAVTLWAGREMFMVLNVAGMTGLEWALLAIFCLNICWIAFAFASASVGFAVVAVRELLHSRPAGREPPQGRTAVLFPIYNEDVRRVFATVESAAASLADAAPGRFECFILSDSTDPDVALLEEAAFTRLKQRLGDDAPAYYRRRTVNRARKSGNVEDFVTRWGGRYDYMIVYDADSYMETETLLELARRMDREPATGLIQTVPRLVGGKTLFARAQQFAAGLYGPLLGAGVSWWAQDEGNFWGHNAIIRIRAFAESAGLPVIPGKAPFGGPILSHDFVEAALLRRAGWRVKIADDLSGSYEECPPTIIDLTIRDRRWCQGNMQHAGVLARMGGLKWTNRLHLMIGVMSYLASPTWLLLILVGMALSLQGKFLQPQYFGDEAVLFPNWPVIDSARALALFGATMAILFAPKLYGLVAGWLSKRWRRSVGVTRTTLGVLVETLLSVLVAPILMAAQTSAVASILFGRDAGWTPQQRDAGGYSAKDAFRRHGQAMMLGVVLLVSALLISPIFAAWLAPAMVGLILAGPLSYWTGSNELGAAFARAGLLATPEEIDAPSSFGAARRAAEAYRDVAPPRFVDLLASESADKERSALADPRWPLAEGDVHAPLALAVARADLHDDPAAYAAALPKAEKLALLNAPDALAAVRQTLRRRALASRVRQGADLRLTSVG
ncbi:MAG: glucans biosynthesis glucosyltransferase MdoH [Pseudomonadota bacterium]|nr:glucans biosynthesis glucosyltransferase MdoH [Pseudomonadota bacterium]